MQFSLWKRMTFVFCIANVKAGDTRDQGINSDDIHIDGLEWPKSREVGLIYSSTQVPAHAFVTSS